LKPSSSPDNFLLEIEEALQHQAKKRLAIFPIAVGSVNAQGQYKPAGGEVFDLSSFSKLPSPTSSDSPSETLSKLFTTNGWLPPFIIRNLTPFHSIYYYFRSSCLILIDLFSQISALT
jgi:hypothetical protein